MEYYVYVPVSSLHRGALQFLWAPDEDGFLNSEQTSQLPNVILDVSNGSEFHFTVGYQSHHTVLRNEVLSGNLFARSVPFGGALSTELYNGIFYVKVNTPLTAMAGPTSTTCFIFARACEDMEFSVPRETISSFVGDSGDDQMTFRESFAYQMALGDGHDTLQSFVLVPPSGPSRTHEVTSGESFMSVRPFFQKFTQIPLGVSVWLNASASEYVYVPHFGAVNFGLGDDFIQVGPGNNGVENFTFSWFVHYTLMYWGIAGGTRYKALFDGNSSINMSGCILTVARFDPATRNPHFRPIPS